MTGKFRKKQLQDIPKLALTLGMSWLNETYGGKCIRLRRSGDDAELDIGFDSNGNVDSTTALAWIAAGGGTQQGFIVTWYDQSGYGIDITQSTAANQAEFVATEMNGFPSNKFVVSDIYEKAITGYYSPSTIFFVLRPKLNTGSYFFASSALPANDCFEMRIRSADNAIRMRLTASNGVASNVAIGTVDYYNPQILTLVFDGINNYKAYINGVEKVDITNPNGFKGKFDLYKIGWGFATYYQGYMSEVLIYKDNLNDDDRETVENQLKAKYNIT